MGVPAVTTAVIGRGGAAGTGGATGSLAAREEGAGLGARAEDWTGAAGLRVAGLDAARCSRCAGEAGAGCAAAWDGGSAGAGCDCVCSWLL